MYGQKPFEHVKTPVEEQLRNQFLPAKKENIDESHWSLMKRCWEFDLSKRVNVVGVSVGITRLIDGLS